MVSNLLRLGIRNLYENKFFSLVSVLSLSLGFTLCLIITLFVYDETHHDTFHDSVNPIYRVALKANFSGQDVRTSVSNPYLTKVAVKELPEVIAATRIFRNPNALPITLTDNAGKSYQNVKFLVADSNFFQFFSFPMIDGDPARALDLPKKIVLTQSAAKGIFGTSESLIGKKVFIDTLREVYTISGICKDPPLNSHIQFQALFSWSTFPVLDQGEWMANTIYSYLKIDSENSVKTINRKIDSISRIRMSAVLKRTTGQDFDQFKKSGGSYQYLLYPISDTYLKTPDLAHDMQPKNDMVYVAIFSIIGVLVLVICSSNFLNLTIAQSINRSKEIGVRTYLGSDKRMIILQFVIESALYVLVSLLLAIAITAILIPAINQLITKTISTLDIGQPVILIPLILFISLLTIITGTYTVLINNSENGGNLFNGFRKRSPRNRTINEVLIITQFTIMFIVGICTVHIFMQTSYLSNKEKGLTERQVVIVKELANLGEKRNLFIEQLAKNSLVEKQSQMIDLLPHINRNLLFRSVSTQKDFFFAVLFTDISFHQVLKLDLLEGAYFSNDRYDSLAVVINEAASNEFGLTIGSRLSDPNTLNKDTLRIIGIVRDFRYDQYNDNIRPMAIRQIRSGNNLLVRYRGDREAIENDVAALWKMHAPSKPLEIEYLEDKYDALLAKEIGVQKLFTIFTIVILVVALIGLNAMSLMNVEYRIKEVAIRKVLGANSRSIMFLLSSGSSRYLLIAFALALYPSYYLIDLWLGGFDDGISTNYWVFAIVGLAGYLISISTVAYMTLKASNTNPVNLLRYE